MPLHYCLIFLFDFDLASDDEFENLRIKGPNAVQLVKTTPLKPSSLPVIPDTIKEVIYDMLNALAAYHAPEEGMCLASFSKQDSEGCVFLLLSFQIACLSNYYIHTVLESKSEPYKG